MKSPHFHAIDALNVGTQFEIPKVELSAHHNTYNGERYTADDSEVGLRAAIPFS